MALIPTYGDWITFPLAQVTVVQIERGSDKTQQRSRYYVEKAWYGDLVTRTSPSDGIRPIGETVIFIAAEYIEPRMKGAPHLKHLHLVDRMAGRVSGHEAGWGLFQLNEKFHYGQNNDQTFRWIVYHPPAIAGRERKIYQHRFIGNTSQTIADLGIELAALAVNAGTIVATSGQVQPKIPGILSRIKSVFDANISHGLHQFEPLLIRSTNNVQRYRNSAIENSEEQTDGLSTMGFNEKKPDTDVDDLEKVGVSTSPQRYQRGVQHFRSSKGSPSDEPTRASVGTKTQQMQTQESVIRKSKVMSSKHS